MTSKVSRVAQLLKTGEDSARIFCEQIQEHFPAEKPSFAAIAEFLEKHPGVARNAVSVARAIQAERHDGQTLNHDQPAPVRTDSSNERHPIRRYWMDVT